MASEGEARTLLDNIGLDHPFWVGAETALNRHPPFFVPFALSDPRRYGSGLPTHAFETFLRLYKERRLTPDDAATAIEKLSEACQPREWREWYKPILSGTLRLNVSLQLYNEIAPVSRMVSETMISTPRLHRSLNIPSFYRLQPVYSKHRVVWANIPVGKKTFVRAYGADGVLYPWSALEKEMGARVSGLVFESYVVGNRVVLSDVVTWPEYMFQKTSAPFEDRRAILEGLFRTQFSTSKMLTLAECEEAGPDPEDAMGLLIEQGFDSIVIRNPRAVYKHTSDSGTKFFDEILDHEFTFTMKVIEIVAGDPGSKYEGTTRYIIAEGDNHQARIFLGLTRKARDLAWSNRDKLIGAELIVAGSAYTDAGLVAPVFKQWKTDV